MVMSIRRINTACLTVSFLHHLSTLTVIPSSVSGSALTFLQNSPIIYSIICRLRGDVDRNFKKRAKT